ncbi:MAG TPA: hypothetical protein VK151_16405 [Fluviicola sp.]|nr:hypothetical protein [Fluviicola sp.]
MSHEEEDDDLPFLLRVIVFAFQVVFVILFIVFTLLTFGIFLSEEDSSVKEQHRRKTISVEEKLRINLARKKNRLVLVRKRINELQLVVSKIRRSERRLFFAVRLVITSLLLFVNWQYLTFLDIDPTVLIKKVLNLGDHLKLNKSIAEIVEIVTNFNAMIILLYSVPAYLLYGTIGRFTKGMKTKTISILRKKHIPTLSELQFLREEEQQLIRDIGYLKNSLELFD